MEIETWFKVEYEDCVGDYFDDETDLTEKEIADLIEQHIQDYCEEHNIDRSCVKIIE